jgi:hypothetical protein
MSVRPRTVPGKSLDTSSRENEVYEDGAFWDDLDIVTCAAHALGCAVLRRPKDSRLFFFGPVGNHEDYLKSHDGD